MYSSPEATFPSQKQPKSVPYFPHVKYNHRIAFPVGDVVQYYDTDGKVVGREFLEPNNGLTFKTIDIFENSSDGYTAMTRYNIVSSSMGDAPVAEFYVEVNSKAEQVYYSGRGVEIWTEYDDDGNETFSQTSDGDVMWAFFNENGHVVESINVNIPKQLYVIHEYGYDDDDTTVVSITTHGDVSTGEEAVEYTWYDCTGFAISMDDFAILNKDMPTFVNCNRN